MGYGRKLGIMRGLCSMGGFGQEVVIPTSPITSTTLVANAVSTSSTTTPSFGTLNLGTAASTRYIFVLVTGFAWDSVSGLTIGGNAATLEYSNNSSGLTVWSRLVTTGTSAAIAATGGGSAQFWYASVWRVISSSAPTVVASVNDTAKGGGVSGYDPASATITTTYTNAPVIASQITQGITTNQTKRSSAALLVTTNTGSFTISTTNSSTNTTYTGATEQYDAGPVTGFNNFQTTSLDLISLS